MAQCCLFLWRPSASLMKRWREFYCTSHFSEVWPVMTTCHCFVISRDLCSGNGKQWCWSLFDLYAWNPAFHISNFEFLQIFYLQFSSVPQSCPTPCDPMNLSTPGLPVHHQPPEFTQTYVHWVGDAIQPSHPLSSPFLPAPNPSQHHSLFQWVNSSHEVAKVLEFQLQHHSFQRNPRADPI